MDGNVDDQEAQGGTSLYAKQAAVDKCWQGSQSCPAAVTVHVHLQGSDHDMRVSNPDWMRLDGRHRWSRAAKGPRRGRLE